MTKHLTNEQFMRRLMAGALTPHTVHVALVQAFVVDAISKLAEKTSTADAAELDTPFMSGQAWKDAAAAVRSALITQYGG